jgi:phosphoribosylformylglycinamidine synthase
MRRGNAALSDFRIAKLLDRLRTAVPSVERVTAHYQYLIDLAAPLSPEQSRRLDALLQAGGALSRFADEDAAEPAMQVWVVPRSGTISP